jgi:hypothetical protein
MIHGAWTSLGRVPRLTELERRHGIVVWSLDQEVAYHCDTVYTPGPQCSQTIAAPRRLQRELTSRCVGLGRDPRARILQDMWLQRYTSITTFRTTETQRRLICHQMSDQSG